MAHNFYVGNLGFHKVLNDDHPYERATAPFRKEQFDAAATVGDQSLTGWWTRGQLSFHRGGGVKYYEVLEGEEILNRFNTCATIDPWTPGEVTLPYAQQDLTLSGVMDAIQVSNLTLGNRLLTLHTDGTLRVIQPDYYNFGASSITSLPTSNGAAAVAITGSAFRAYIAVENRIETYFVGDTTTSTLWTGDAGRSLVNVWYMKGRLWVVDNYGDWFMLSTAGGTFVVGDADFSIPDLGWLVSSTALWSAVETPSSILIGAYSTIFSVVLDETAATPTPTPPVAVAQLPDSEGVASLGYHLGHVVIATDKGARFAIQGANEIVYGPLVTTASFGPTERMARRGTRVLLTGSGPEGEGVFAFDLGSQIADLSPAWALEQELTLGDYAGSYTIAGSILLWSSVDTSLHLTSPGVTVSAAGSVTTGYHRFGTLEGKHFESVTVRAAGDGGTISVYLVNADETETLVGTLTLPGDTLGVFPLGLTEPTERIALRFALARDAVDTSVSPVLLGYQLKALPSPKRQRLIRVPLMMFDIERGPTGRAVGKEKDAWTRYQALEALEESDALVTFEDKDTGETGTAYIESVELVQRNGSKGVSRANGFGGIVSLTLRKVA